MDLGHCGIIIGQRHLPLAPQRDHRTVWDLIIFVDVHLELFSNNQYAHRLTVERSQRAVFVTPLPFPSLFEGHWQVVLKRAHFHNALSMQLELDFYEGGDHVRHVRRFPVLCANLLLSHWIKCGMLPDPRMSCIRPRMLRPNRSKVDFYPSG